MLVMSMRYLGAVWFDPMVCAPVHQGMLLLCIIHILQGIQECNGVKVAGHMHCSYVGDHSETVQWRQGGVAVAL